MSNLSLARIMYGSSEGVRTASGLSFSSPSFHTMLSMNSGSSTAPQVHSSLTLQDLLHKAWLVLSTKL